MICEACYKKICETGYKKICETGYKEICETCYKEICETGYKEICETGYMEIDETGYKEIAGASAVTCGVIRSVSRSPRPLSSLQSAGRRAGVDLLYTCVQSAASTTPPPPGVFVAKFPPSGCSSGQSRFHTSGDAERHVNPSDATALVKNLLHIL
ncbi:hypothetical protein ACOMHN_043845 [Nucella lapillus]